jgi:hypothetical protein
MPTADHRVAYTKAGNRIAAARIDDVEALVDHKLYWAAVSGIDEARYLTAILNSAEVLRRVAPLQAVGLFGARDFDKNVFSVPIPTYDATLQAHAQLVSVASEAEAVAAATDLVSHGDFKKARAAVREALEASGVGARLEAAVTNVIGTDT